MAYKKLNINNTNSVVVRKLRDQKLSSGLPFMINAKGLSSNECYLEYPDGSIKLINVIHSSREINVVRELSSSDARNLRNHLKFSVK